MLEARIKATYYYQTDVEDLPHRPLRTSQAQISQFFPYWQTALAIILGLILLQTLRSHSPQPQPNSNSPTNHPLLGGAGVGQTSDTHP